MKNKLEELCGQAIKLGAADARVIESKNIVVKNSVRWGCRFGCEDYGKSLMCPPYSPTPEETQALLREYEYALLVRKKTSSDIRKKTSSDDLHKLILDLEHYAFLQGFYSALGFKAGRCRLCEKCDVERGLCVYPKQARPSMEGCGVDVFLTARNAGYEMEILTNKEQEYYIYGLLLIK